MCSKHVEASNILIIKVSASSWLILKNKYIEVHGQQNIKIFVDVFLPYMYLVSYNLHLLMHYSTCPTVHHILNHLNQVHAHSSSLFKISSSHVQLVFPIISFLLLLYMSF